MPTTVGFVDLQMNGYLGINLSDENLTVQDVHNLANELTARGTVAYCPTLVSLPMEQYRRNLGVVVKAMEDPALSKRMLGIHLDGPFLSSRPGDRGVHVEDSILRPNLRLFEQLMEWSRDRLRIITLAPELEGADELMRRAVSSGVVVSIGHHEADRASLDKAVPAGVSCCTHFGNGISNLVHRFNNPLWWQLACDEVAATIITDGHHLPPELIKTVLRGKGVKRRMVVSDACALAGMPTGVYCVNGQTVTIEESSRKTSEKTGSLAGSHSSMLECMNYLASLRLLGKSESSLTQQTEQWSVSPMADSSQMEVDMDVKCGGVSSQSRSYKAISNRPPIGTVIRANPSRMTGASSESTPAES